MSPAQVLKRPKVVVLGSAKFRASDDVAQFHRDFDVTVLDAQSRLEAMDSLADVVQQEGPVYALIVRAGTQELGPFDQELLQPLVGCCQVVASARAGREGFDVDWMTAHNMWFCNAAEGAAEAAADLAMFLILAVVRDAFRAERGARSGICKAGSARPSRDPSGMTLAIVGMGRVGKHLARKAAAFNMRVKYHNRRRLCIDDEADFNAYYVASLHELLAQADVVSVNCAATPETAGLVSTAEFGVMKHGAFLIDTAGGGVVDGVALRAALESGQVARAGLDVEPPPGDDFLRASERVICMPRMGAVTDEAFRRGDKECLNNVRACWKIGRPLVSVNEVLDGIKDGVLPVQRE